MINIFSYLDYQLFLRDYYEEKKKETVFFSYRYMGNKIGLDAGFLLKVIQGKMHLAIKSLPRITEFLKLNEVESEYFDTLVRFGRADASSEIKAYFEKLLSLKNVDAHTLSTNQYEFYQKWYYSAIRELLSFYDFKGNYSLLAKKLSPQITPTEAKTAIVLLVKLCLICKDTEGRYVQTDKFISTSEKWKSAAIHSFQKEMIDLAGESLDRHPKEHRDISTLTVSVSQKDFDEIRERLADLRKLLLKMTNNNEADCVYQINIQAYPLSEIPKS